MLLPTRSCLKEVRTNWTCRIVSVARRAPILLLCHPRERTDLTSRRPVIELVVPMVFKLIGLLITVGAHMLLLLVLLEHLLSIRNLSVVYSFRLFRKSCTLKIYFISSD